MSEDDFLTATRATYDAVAGDYAERFRDELDVKPMDRALLAAYAEMVLAGPGEPAGLVADIGCGPGHVAAHLRTLGLAARGIDLSPAMVASARASYPDVRYDVGSMTALDLSDGELDGIVAFYSIIHIPTDQLPLVFAEFARVLAPGGLVLLAFQGGAERKHLTEWLGHDVAVDFYLRSPELVADLLTAAGLRVQLRLVREPDKREQSPRAYLIARKPE